jgi:hypothetical protein
VQGEDRAQRLERENAELREALRRPQAGSGVQPQHQLAGTAHRGRLEGLAVGLQMEEILNSQEFLMIALSEGEGLFLPPRVGSADYPFTYVLFSPATLWPGKSLTLDFDRFVSSIGGETEGAQIFPTIARATFANAHPVCADMTRAARRINHCARVLQFCRSLSRKHLNMLSGLVAADESFLFLTPEHASRPYLRFRFG